MPANLLETTRVEKPWGRHDLWPGFEDQPADKDPIGEIWFKKEGDTKPDLLIKYLFTSKPLSVQVHPNDEQAHERGLPRGKDECWNILAAGADSTIALGTHEPISHDRLRDGAIDGSIERLLDWKKVAAGDFLYCKSDTIHAIGGGLTVIEIQQNSETTYRLYDYGSDRELHLTDGIAVADPVPYVPITSPGDAGDGRYVQVEGPKFVLEKWAGGERRVALPDGVTGWLVPITGSGEVGGVAWKAGQCVTVTGAELVKASDDAKVLFAYPGTTRMMI